MIVSVVGILYFIQRGLRSGLYPSLVFFLTTASSLAFTITTYELGAHLLKSVIPHVTWPQRLAVSYWLIQAVSFVCVSYFTFRCLAQTMPFPKHLDRLGGLAFGVLNGITVTGMLLLLWFILPFAERVAPVQTERLLIKPHELVLRGYGQLVRIMPGGREFQAERVFQEMRFGRPRPPGEGQGGLWICSIPAGCRVFVCTDEKITTAERFKADLTSWVAKEEPDPKAQSWHMGRTPVRFGVDDKAVWIAVERVLEKGQDAMDFLPDGEVDTWEAAPFNVPRTYKIYRRIREKDELLTLISLFQSKHATKPKEIERYFPASKCYEFDEAALMKDLAQRGVTEGEQREIIAHRLALAGKVLFELGGKLTALEWQPGGKWKFIDPAHPLGALPSTAPGPTSMPPSAPARSSSADPQLLTPSPRTPVPPSATPVAPPEGF